MRPIDADAYMEKVRYEAKAMPQKQGETFVILSEWIMEKTPSIESKRGKWIFKTIFPNDKSEFPMGYLECSVCGSHHRNATPCNYCDNCGADMRNNSEKLNNSTISKMEQVDKDINVRSKNEL